MTISHRSLSQREKPYKEQIELLESLNKSYSQQIAELHSSKEMLLKQLRENTKFSSHSRSGFFPPKITRPRDRFPPLLPDKLGPEPNKKRIPIQIRNPPNHGQTPPKITIKRVPKIPALSNKFQSTIRRL